MLENLVPSNQKYSDDPAEQAFATHVERRTLRLAIAFVGQSASGRIPNLASLQDFVWEQALDFVAPMEPEVRDELRRAKTGLPWASRSDLDLYWRLMYAGHVEMLMDADVNVFDARTTRRPLKQVVAATAVLLGQLAKPPGGSDPGFLEALTRPGSTPIGRVLHRGVVDRAADQVRIRMGRQTAPKPLEPFMPVRVGGIAAEVSGYGFDGTVTVSRETAPTDSGGFDWKLDVRSARWQASVWPWQIETSF